jgi:hypothetical protein
MSDSMGTTSIVSTRATISRYDAESTKRSAHGVGQDVEGLAHITMSTTAHDAAPMLIGWCELRKDFRRFHASLSGGRDHRHRLSARAAGLLSLAGGSVSAQTVGLSHAVNMLAINPSHEITLSEEEVSDVSLATFCVFDKEKSPRMQLVARAAAVVVAAVVVVVAAVPAAAAVVAAAVVAAAAA